MSRGTIDSLRRLMEVGIALSAEKDNDRLMELILNSAKDLTRADGGTLYTRTENDELEFQIMLTDSLDISLGGSSGSPVELPAVPLFDREGRPNDRMVAARAAVTGQTVNVPDAYDTEEFDFAGTRVFDEKTGYRSKSFLTVPMRNHQDEVIGVLQLINAMAEDSGDVVVFDQADQLLVESLASQAAIALTNGRLIEEQRVLFEAFIELIAAAIDEKSTYTGAHCRRVPELTMMLADAAARVSRGPLADFSMTEEDRYELKIAGWLHDCGKVTTPEYVVDKATKLETIYDRIALVRSRFATLRQEKEKEAWRREAELVDPPGRAGRMRVLAAELAQLDEECRFIEHCNVGSECMRNEDQARVREIARREWVNHRGERQALLSDEEVRNLTIQRGTLNPEEREIINQHIVATIKMLESLPYPKHLRRVPEFAGGHHERMDGTGYPRGLRREEMSVQARAMAIADIFEALTAGDRPYKEAMKISQALTILGRMKQDQHVDPDLFDVFIREKVYLRYADKFLEPRQIDEVDLGTIPGYVVTPEQVRQ